MDNSSLAPPTPFETRIQALQKRVNEAADALHAKGIKPTVQRIRAALGGGSPNDLTPALKHWRDEILPTLRTIESEATGIPPQVADLARELWTRAMAAAEIDRKGGAAAIARVARSEEAHALHAQISGLRDRLASEAMKFGELRAQAAMHEAIAKEALGRVRGLEARERHALAQLGESKQQIAELEARFRQFPMKTHPKAKTPPANRTRRTSPSNQKKRRSHQEGKPNKRTRSVTQRRSRKPNRRK